jgi:hypothetical protein
MTTPPADEQPSPSGCGVAGAGLGCLAGAFVVPIVVFVIVLIRNAFDPVCGTPADSGGCEMGLFAIPITSVVPGVLIGIVAGFALGRQRASRPGPKP